MKKVSSGASLMSDKLELVAFNADDKLKFIGQYR